MIVTVDGDGILSKTFLEIKSAAQQGNIIIVVSETETSIVFDYVTHVMKNDEDGFEIDTINSTYIAASIDGYPVRQL